MSQTTIALPHDMSGYDECLNVVTARMSHKFGGFTQYPEAVGGWVNESGERIDEPVNIIQSYSDMSGGQLIGIMRPLARQIYQLSDESAVMFTVNHDAYFVSGD